MIKIYNADEVNLEKVLAQADDPCSEKWSYPVDEVQYLLDNGTAFGYVLIKDAEDGIDDDDPFCVGDRLMEIDEDDLIVKNVAQEMAQKAVDSIDEVGYKALYEEALREIENVSKKGCRSFEFQRDTYHESETMRKTINSEVCWDRLKDDLRKVGFRVRLIHHLGPARYGYSLEIEW